MTFDDFYLIPELQRALKDAGYRTATPIQEQAIPAMQRGRDILASAQTGTGKTASFALPILNQIDLDSSLPKFAALNLVLLPTRELADQVHKQFRQYGENLKIRTCVAFGGVNIESQIRLLRNGVHLLVATPGRLLDLLDQGVVTLDHLQTLVLDEADKMLDLGFYEDLEKILAHMPAQRQTVMFSATFSQPIRALAREMLHTPVEISIAPKQIAAKGVSQWLHPVDKKSKIELCSELFAELKVTSSIAFCKTKRGVDQLTAALNEANISATSLHGDKSQAARSEALSLFKQGKFQVLVATDVAARGIDITELPLVVNVDLPVNAEDYIHRIGRTGRAGKTGTAISLVAADEIDLLRAIESLLKKPIERRFFNNWEPNHALPPSTPKNTNKQRKTNTKRGSKNRNEPNSKKPKASERQRQEESDHSPSLRPGSPFGASTKLRTPKRRKLS